MSPTLENNNLNAAQTSIASADVQNPETETTAGISAPAFSISSGDGSTSTGDDGEGATFEMPFDLGIVVDAKSAIDAFKKLNENGRKVIDVVENSENVMGDVNDLKSDTSEIVQKLVALNLKYNGDEKLEEADAEDLHSLAQTFASSFVVNFEQVKKPALFGYNKISTFKGIDSNSQEISNALHEAYRNDDSNLLTHIGNMVEQIEGYNSSFEKASGFAKMISSKIAGSKLMEQLDGYSEKVQGTIDNVKAGIDFAVELNSTFDAIGNAGSDLSGPVEGMNSVFNLMDSGFECIADVPGLKIISALWINCYGPAVDFCMEGMGRIANLREKGFEDIVDVTISKWLKSDVNDDNKAPTRVKDLIEGKLTGGWELFNYMWDVMCGESSRLGNEAVIKYFEDNYYRIDAASKDEDPLPYDGIGPFWSIDPADLMRWSLDNKYLLWSLFYGTKLPFPPKTTAPS